MEKKYEAREADQVMMTLADDLVKANSEVKRLKDGIREVKKYLDEHSGTVDKPRIMTMDETYEVFDRLTKLLNA